MKNNYAQSLFLIVVSILFFSISNYGQFTHKNNCINKIDAPSIMYKGNNNDNGMNLKKASQSSENDYDRFEIKLGMDGFSFIDPMLAGFSYNVKIYQTDMISGELDGFRILTGGYINFSYYFNENFGLLIDFNILGSEEDVYTFETNYLNKAEIHSFRLGAVGRLTNQSSPVRLLTSLGFGQCGISLEKHIIPNDPANGKYTYMQGDGGGLILFYSVETSFFIYKPVFIFGNLEYAFTPVGDFTLYFDGGEYKYYSFNAGGMHFRFGLGAAF